MLAMATYDFIINVTLINKLHRDISTNKIEMLQLLFHRITTIF